MSPDSHRAPVLLIEDEPEIVEHGYDVVSAPSSAEGLALFRSAQPRLVILDIMSPGKNGFEVCREFRGESAVPVIILTVRGNVMDRIVGLELGADDYPPEPFEPRELLTRMQTILRRTSGEKPRPGFEGLSIDPGLRAVVVFGEPVELSTTEFEALYFLAKHPGQAMHRDQLMVRLRAEADQSLEAHGKPSSGRRAGTQRDTRGSHPVEI